MLERLFNYCLISLFFIFSAGATKWIFFLSSSTLHNVLQTQRDRKYLSAQAVITSYLHMGAVVPIRDRDNKGSRETVGRLPAERTRPCPLFLFHLELFLSLTRGGFAGLAAGLRGGLLLGGEYGP